MIVAYEVESYATDNKPSEWRTERYCETKDLAIKYIRQQIANTIFIGIGSGKYEYTVTKIGSDEFRLCIEELYSDGGIFCGYKLHKIEIATSEYEF